MGVWNHLNGKRVFVLERDGENLRVRITEDTAEIARFDLPLSEVTIDNGSVALSDSLYSKLKEFD